MKLSHKTIEILGKLISGDSGMTEYKSGPVLVRFFNDTRIFNDDYGTYGGGAFPSRWKYVEDNLKEVNKTDNLNKIIESYFNPVNFIGNEEVLKNAVQELNKYLIYDGYEIKIENNNVYILSKEGAIIKIDNKEKIKSEFAKEQLKKCEDKISSGDYDGAITNARSLVEDVIRDIYNKITGKELISKGDLGKDYSELKKELNLSENKYVDSSIKQITSGLTSIINGMAVVRNKMGDGHSREVKPQKHHAKLLVNCSKTLVDFLYDTLEYQEK